MNKNIGAKAQAKKDAAKARHMAVKNAETPEKRYDLYGSVNPVLEKHAKQIIEEKKMNIEIKYGRFTVRDIDAQKVDEIKNNLKECIVSTHNGKKVTKISFFTLKAAQLRPKTTRDRQPTNNTTEAKIAAKKARKDRNKAVAAARHEYAAKRKLKKQNLVVGRRAKLYYPMNDENGNVVMKRVNQKRGFKGSTLENHRRQRANKAGQYLLKQEAKSAATTQKKAVIKPLTAKKKKTVVQQEMALAA